MHSFAEAPFAENKREAQVRMIPLLPHKEIWSWRWRLNYLDSRSLDKLKFYFELNHLKSNPAKPEVCVFHMCKKGANKKFKVIWLGQESMNDPTQK